MQLTGQSDGKRPKNALQSAMKKSQNGIISQDCLVFDPMDYTEKKNLKNFKKKLSSPKNYLKSALGTIIEDLAT